VNTFAGGIANSKGGVITAKPGAGIGVGAASIPGIFFVSSFSGGITNGGTISAASDSGASTPVL
jgi:hypothetical protein